MNKKLKRKSECVQLVKQKIIVLALKANIEKGSFE